jgi:hypothetical protein
MITAPSSPGRPDGIRGSSIIQRSVHGFVTAWYDEPEPARSMSSSAYPRAIAAAERLLTARRISGRNSAE